MQCIEICDMHRFIFSYWENSDDERLGICVNKLTERIITLFKLGERGVH